MNKRNFPKIHFYDQDFVDIYDKTWAWIDDFWTDVSEAGSDKYFIYLNENHPLVIDQTESIFATFFLVYSNRNYQAHQNLDYLYSKQEESGAIRAVYDLKTGSPVINEDNPEGMGLPLFAWAEYNLYHKSANKRRVKEVMPILQKYMAWIDKMFKKENGLYSVPVKSGTVFDTFADDTYYSVNFNSAVAISALYIAALGDILNDKDINFQYKRLYFSLKTRINSLMWDNKTGFYHDLNEAEERLSHKTIAGFFPLLAEIPNEDKAELLIAHLTNVETFGTDHPFPSLSVDNEKFSANGEGFHGSVFPLFNFIVIKGLEKYQRYDLARETAIRHLYYILDGMFPPNAEGKTGDLWEAYLPWKEGPAMLTGDDFFPKKRCLAFAGLSGIVLMIENVIGLSISLPRKTVDWIIPNLETMGIENLSLKRNMITILSTKGSRGWEIQMESEKLYYFTINILGQKKKTLPIPSGKCSMLIDKL